jgi:hypothetical protein
MIFCQNWVSLQEKLNIKIYLIDNYQNLAYSVQIWSKYHYILHYLLILVIFCKNLTIQNNKKFGQKIVALAQ